MDQLVQVLGSLLVLAAFVAAQRGWLATDSRRYLSLNLVGAGVLAVLAAHERQLGFLLLEFCWALQAGYSLMQRAGKRRRRRALSGCRLRRGRLRPQARRAREPRARQPAQLHPEPTARRAGEPQPEPRLGQK